MAAEAIARAPNGLRDLETQLCLLLLARAFEQEPSVSSFSYRTQLNGGFVFIAQLNDDPPRSWLGRPRHPFNGLARFEPLPESAPRGQRFKEWSAFLSHPTVARFEGARFSRPANGEPLARAIMRQGLPASDFARWLAGFEADALRAENAGRVPSAGPSRSI